jgi:hypothetical protein
LWRGASGSAFSQLPIPKPPTPKERFGRDFLGSWKVCVWLVVSSRSIGWAGVRRLGASGRVFTLGLRLDDVENRWRRLDVYPLVSEDAPFDARRSGPVKPTLRFTL